MTATQLYTELSTTTLVGLKISALEAQDITNLLAFINEAKNKIAKDTRMWVGGETISMVTGTSEYTLTSMPIQIIDVFDDNNILRPRNNQGIYGYFQTSPKDLIFNTITNGLDVKVNYYYTPPDYAGGDEIVMPEELIEAIKLYVSYKAFSIYKGDSDVMKAKEYKNDYKTSISEFKSVTDVTDVDSIMNLDNKIWLRCIR